MRWRRLHWAFLADSLAWPMHVLHAKRRPIAQYPDASLTGYITINYLIRLMF
jgi:hypothetical protein